MSYLAVNWTYTSKEVLNAGLLPSDLAVLRALCWHFKDVDTRRSETTCFPGVKRLMKVTGLKRGAVNAAKKRLMAKGLITWDRAANFGDNALFRTNSYHINCPQLEKKLRKNEQDAKPPVDPNEDYNPPDFPLTPGVLYIRPEPERLRDELKLPIADEVYVFLADALAFVCDRPENRQSLVRMLSTYGGDLAGCRKALTRVLATSSHGRVIQNRIAYLLSTIYRTARRQSL